MRYWFWFCAVGPTCPVDSSWQTCPQQKMVFFSSWEAWLGDNTLRGMEGCSTKHVQVNIGGSKVVTIWHAQLATIRFMGKVKTCSMFSLP